jgi:hypothetical protein
MQTSRAPDDVDPSRSELRLDAAVLSASELAFHAGSRVFHAGSRVNEKPNEEVSAAAALAIHKAIDWIWEDALHENTFLTMLPEGTKSVVESTVSVVETVSSIEWACGGREAESKGRVSLDEARRPNMAEGSVLSFLTESNAGNKPCEVS